MARTRKPEVAQPVEAVWQSHEEHVSALYRSMGYSVRSNTNVDGQQVDLICDKWVEGAGKVTLYVDCKHTDRPINTSVSKDDVDQFIYSFRSRADSNGWTAGVLVSNRPFTQFAKAAAQRHANVHLKTISDLHEDLLHIRSYLTESVHRYEETSQFSDYIDPLGIPSSTPSPGGGSPVLLDTLVAEWLVSQDQPQLCLFGDFGTGKTTFLQHVHYAFAKRYLSNSDERIPLLVPLRAYYEAVDASELIERFFALTLKADVNYATFLEFLRAGRFLLLLDGFDEMGARSDPSTRKASYLKLAPFVTELSKTIISCRPAYFLSLQETQSVFSFVTRQIGFSPITSPAELAQHIYRAVHTSDLKDLFAQTKTALGSTIYAHMELFTKSQIRAYLRRHESEIKHGSNGRLNSTSLLKRISNIYDLEDLARRPILLKLIVSTLPLLVIDKVAMAQLVGRLFPGDDTEQAFILTDIRTCSFLTRDPQDAVRFTHKSFMEYYTAVHIRTTVHDREVLQGLLSMRELSDEIVYFLGDSIASSRLPKNETSW